MKIEVDLKDESQRLDVELKNYTDITDEAKQGAAHDAEVKVWDNIVKQKNARGWSNAFANWGDVVPPYLIKITGNASNAFGSSEIKNFRADDFDLSEVTNYASMFINCIQLEFFDYDLEFKNDAPASAMFYNCTNLKYIKNIIVPQDFQWPNNIFTACASLEYIHISGKFSSDLYFAQSKKLKKSVIIHLITCLDEEAVGSNIRFSITAVRREFETEAGKNDGDKSDEWYALIDTKPNWTVILS